LDKAINVEAGIENAKKLFGPVSICGGTAMSLHAAMSRRVNVAVFDEHPAKQTLPTTTHRTGTENRNCPLLVAL
jgi:hypothetical protein